MITWDTLTQMTEALAFANDIQRRRQSVQRYFAFEATMAKLTEAENEVKTISGQSYITLKNYRPEDIVNLAETISKAKLKAYVHEGTCPHVIRGAAPCVACIRKESPKIAEEAIKLACAQLPKSFGRVA